MAWGEEGVTKLQYKSDSVTPWGGANGTVKTVPVTKAGIIRNLRMIQGGGALSFAGATTASKMGPYNAYKTLELLGNSQQDIFRFSGYGCYLINLVKHGLEGGNPPVNTTVANPINVTDQDYVFDGTATSAPTTNTQWNWSLDLPVSQQIRSIGGDVGMIPMSTENAQLAFQFTPNAVSVSGTTYTMQSASDDLSAPYYGANAVTIADPSLDLVREMYEAVEDPSNFPDFSWISQWLEETPQTYSGTKVTWKQNQDAGVLLRLIFGVWKSTSPWGVLSGSLTSANAIQLSYNTDIVKFKENGLEALARQRSQLGFDLPYGVFFYDLLGKDLTLADVLSSYYIPSIQLDINMSAITLNTNVNPTVWAQRLLPIRVA
jgi:hypothetical protein